MATRKNRQRGQQQLVPSPVQPTVTPKARPQSRRPSNKKSGTTWQWVVALVVGIGIGWLFGYESGRDSVAISADGTPVQTVNTDSYGRSPGHAHYGHTHP